MNEEKLAKKQLAKIRLEAKKGRVALVRRRVATFGATLVLAFSALVVAISGVPLLFGSQEETAQTTEVVETEGIEQRVGATVVAFAGEIIGGDDDDDEDEEEGGGFFSTSTSAGVESSQS